MYFPVHREISIHDMDNDISKLIKASKAYGQDNNWKAQGLQILDYKQEYQKRQSNEDSDSNKASQYIQKRLVFDRHNKHDLIEPTSRSSKYYDLNADSALLNNNCKKGNKEPQPPNPGPNMVKKKSIGTIEIKKSSKDKPQLQKGTAGLVKQERRSKSKGYNGHSLRDEISGESNYNSYIHGRSSSGNGQIAKSKSKSQPRKRLLKGKEKLETTSNLGKYFSLKTRSKKSETESNIFDRMIAEHFMNKGRTSHYISQEMIKESNRNSKVQDIGRRLNSIRKKAVDEKQYGGSNGKTEETKEKIKKIKVEKTKKKDRPAMLQSAEDSQGMHPKRYTSM
jgi:hypothetical protein